MNAESKKDFIKSVVTLHTNDERNFILNKIANAQGPNDQEENGVWCDFYECFQEMSKRVSNIDIPNLDQNEIEAIKPR